MQEMEDDIVTEEDLLVRHRKEKKNLQAQIQKIKHSVPKGDKKRKKEATDEIAKLEGDLKKKHDEESAKLVASLNEKESVQEVGKGISKLTTDDNDNGPTEEVRKISKAQKRRVAADRQTYDQ
uniref:OTU domain-containing protein n=1 Tax=Octopus bimaculoides TaxID=37653 RepID=A0A0L8I910_OCTBM